MTEIEIKQYEILKYLNQNHVRKNINLEDWAIREQFEFTTHDFNLALNKLLEQRLIVRRENNCIKISDDGEVKFNEWHKQYVEINPIATKYEDQIKELTIDVLRLQRTDLKRKIPFAIIGWIIGLATAIILQFSQKWINGDNSVNVKVDMPKETHDTIILLNKSTPIYTDTTTNK